MSDTTLSQDDLATQEMIAMMEDSNTLEPETEQNKNTDDLNSLLDTLEAGDEEDMVDTTSENEETILELEEDSPHKATEPEEAHEATVDTASDSQIETLENDLNTEATEEVTDNQSTSYEPTEMTVEESEIESDSDTTPIDTELTKLSSKEPSQKAPTQDAITETPSSTDDEVNPHTALAELEAALSLQKETEELAMKVKESTQQTSALALEAARIAQERAHQLQEEINSTYQAAERARLFLENSDIEVEEIPQYSIDELPQVLQEIHAKNEALKEQNKAIQALLD